MIDPLMIITGVGAVASTVHTLADQFGLLDDDDRKEAASLVRSELERNIGVLGSIMRGDKLSESDLVPSQSIDEMLGEAGMSAVVERNKFKEE